MKKVLLSVMVLALSATAAQAAVITYKTVLSGVNENPDIITNGTGTATVIYDSLAHSLDVNVAFSGLTGTTTASHIHCCQADPLLNAGVATTTPTFLGFPLNVTSGTYSAILDLRLPTSYNPAFITANGGTTASAEAVLAAGLAAGQAYLNVHSTFATGGEIRGTLAATVPEPASMALLGLGIAAAASRRARRKS